MCYNTVKKAALGHKAGVGPRARRQHRKAGIGMRDLRRMDRKLSDEDALRVLRESEYGFLATVNGDGSPMRCPWRGYWKGKIPCASTAPGPGRSWKTLRGAAGLLHLRAVCKEPARRVHAGVCQLRGRGKVRLETDEAERQRAMRRIMEKYSAEYIGTPGYYKMMKACRPS